MNGEAAIVAELHRLAAAVERNTVAVERLAADVEALASRGRLSRDDRERLAELLRAAAPVFGDKVFTTVDVFGWPTLAPLVEGHTPSSLAWLFGRAANVTLGDVRIERVGDDRSRALWRLRGEVLTRAIASARGCVPMDPTNTDTGA